jgi:DNA-binding PadR family transcriptional regulator
MGHGRSRENPWAQHGWGGGHWGGWAGGPGPGSGHGRRGGPGGPGGPPPWLAGLFGMGPPEPRRGPRVRRGDVRAAILDVLRAAAERGESINGYQVIQQIADESNGAWRPSPGSVYPTIQQLQDEGLVEEDEERGRRTLRLTADGATYVGENADDLAAVWVPFERSERAERESGAAFADLKPEIGQVMGAVWQILTQGSDRQRAAAVDILVDTRRRLYGVLADGTEQEADEEGEGS